MALTKIERRERIKMRIRKIVSGTAEHPRMTVFRSNKPVSYTHLTLPTICSV